MKPWQRLIARVFALLASAGCACIPLVIRAQGEWTTLKLIVACGAVAVAILLLAFACGPQRWWLRVAGIVAGLKNVSKNDASADSKRWGGRLIIVAAVIAAMQIGWRLSHQDDPWDGDDQGAFLSTAKEIADAGGPVNLVGRLWTGEYAEANRHPLYTGMLSLHSTEEFGRVLSVTFAVLAWFAVVAMTWLRFGPVQSGIVAILLAVNSTWGYFSGMVVCESLLMLLSVLIWWQSLRLCDAGFGAAKFPDPTANGGAPSPMVSGRVSRLSIWLGPLALGALLGLNYLTKGTGIVLLGCVLIWFCWEGLLALITSARRAVFLAALRAGVLTLLAFLLVSSPLIVRNIKRFGQPFYNINTYLLFADQYEGFRELLARGEPVGQVAREYLETHSAADLVQREAKGLTWQTYNIIRMLGPIPLDDGRILFGVPLIGLAIIGVLRAPSAHRRWLAAWVVMQWLVFAWYVAIAAGDRFVLALLPPLLVYAADGIVALWNWRRAISTKDQFATDSMG